MSLLSLKLRAVEGITRIFLDGGVNDARVEAREDFGGNFGEFT